MSIEEELEQCIELHWLGIIREICPARGFQL
jgi:hypothetical protein